MTEEVYLNVNRATTDPPLTWIRTSRVLAADLLDWPDRRIHPYSRRLSQIPSALACHHSGDKDFDTPLSGFFVRIYMAYSIDYSYIASDIAVP